MSRITAWILTAVVGLGVAANVALVTPRIAQTADESLRARLAASASALRAQLELLDARLAPRGLAQNVELAEVFRAPAEGAPVPRPDERALRAAAAVASPDPDLLAVATSAGAVVSRRGRPAQQLEDLNALPPLRALLDSGRLAPAFVVLDKQLYRLAGARGPGNAFVVLTGTLIDDRYAASLRTLLDAEVGFFANGSLVATSLPAGPRRDELIAWRRSPGPGYGRLELSLPALGNGLDGVLPSGTQHFSMRGALLPLDSGAQAALVLPAAPSLLWLARYQAVNAIVLAVILVGGFLWGLLVRKRREEPKKAAPAPEQQPRRQQRPQARKGAQERLQELVDQDEPEVGPIHVRPRHAEEAARGEAGLAAGSSIPKKAADEAAAPFPSRARATESLDPDVAVPAADAWPGDAPSGAAADPVWGTDLLGASAAPFASSPVEAHAQAEDAWDAPAPAPEPARGNSKPPGAVAQARPAGGKAVAAQSAPPRPAPPEEAGHLPGDEPTRIQPISAALLEKLREHDEQVAASAQAPSEADDPDEAHYKDTFEKFVAIRAQTGEGASNVSYEKFAAKLRKNREDLLAKHSARGVRFMVYIKDGKAAIKASAIR
jgi:hypothetical protein